MKQINNISMSKNKTSLSFVLLFLCSILFLGIGSPLWGQHYNIENFSVEEGLAQSFIYSICQDDFGFLWIGTFGGGVDRFDGRDFINFNMNNGLNDNVVNCILKDEDGNLWFGTDNGLSKYLYREQTFLHYNRIHGLNHDRIWKMSKTKDGDILLALYSEGAARFDPNELRFTYFNTKNGLVDNNVISVMEDTKGNLWFGTAQGVSKYNGKTYVYEPMLQKLANLKVNAIYEDSQARIWFGTDKGLFLYDNNQVTRYTTDNGLSSDYVSAILEDRKHHFWIGTYGGGVAHFDGHTFTSFTSKQGLCHNKVETLCEDFEGNIWVGTQLGVSQIKDELFSHISKKDGLKNNTVWSIWQDSQGAMWIATEEGIGIFEPVTGKLTIDNRIEVAYPFYEDKTGHLWLGDGKHILCYDGQSFRNVSKELGLVEDEFISIFEDRQNRMWFGTQRNGLILYDKSIDSVTHFKKEDGLSDNIINVIIQDHQDNIWIGTNDGLTIYHAQSRRFIPFTMADGLINRYIANILIDDDHNLWLGTYGSGILKFSLKPGQDIKKGIFEQFSNSDGLLGEEILSMIFDNSGMLWAGTNKGICRLDIKEYKRSGRKVFNNFGKYDGFPGIECSQNAVFKDKQGNLWFGTIKGATKYNPMEEWNPPVEPLTHITGIKLFQEESDWSEHITEVEKMNFGLPRLLNMPHNNNYVTFHYTGIYLSAPKSVRYQVKLEGFDDYWSPASTSTHITYSNLSPGKYVFKVKSSGSRNLWEKEPEIFPFTIQSPFWGRWWFYLLVALAAIGLLYTFIRIRTIKLVRQQKALKEQIRLHTLELQKEKQKVEQINRDLEMRVEERTRKLELANKQLLQAQKMEAIGTLAGGVAHDLNNVLAGIVSYPELLMLKIPQDSTLYKYADTIKRSGEKAAAIVQDLLTLARRGVDNTEVVNLNSVVSEFLKSPELKKILSYHPNVRIETWLDDHLHNILGSPVHLSKSLMNLVSNAAEAMPDGGAISITTKNTSISKSINRPFDIEPGEYVLWEVSDTGIGIAPEDIEKIFEPFYTKKKMGKSGTGLGMAVVWATVNDHTGSIFVTSTPGKGSLFSLYFPISLKEKSHDVAVTSLQELIGNGETILVVDDVKEQREAAVLMLGQLGYNIEAVSSGEEAIDYVKETPVDLLVLDMIMNPGLGGLETYRQISQMIPGQKAIIVSGFSDNVEVKECQRLGAGAYIKKPFSINQLGQAVKKELHKI
jgi:ligand-binding sensor domain-containing protein/signal transduction histidine kinase/CheY-like chemotaxis protein